MLREKTQLLKRVLFFVDLILIAICFHIAYLVNLIRLGEVYEVLKVDNLLLPAVIIWGIVFWFHPECYEIRLKKLSEILTSVVKASLIAGGLLLSYVFIAKLQQESRLQVGMFATLTFILILLIRISMVLFLRYFRARGYNYQVVLIAGTGKIGKKVASRILKQPQFGWHILGFIDWENRPAGWQFQNIGCRGELKDLPELIKTEQIDRVIFAVSKHDLGIVEGSIRLCEKMGVEVAILVDFFPLKMARMKIDTLFELPFVCYDVTPEVNVSLFIKSLLDRIVSLSGILILAPFLIIVAILIKLTSSGPALFKQVRCGLNGRKFTLYKYRTMVADAESLKQDLMEQNERFGPAFKVTDDPRITRFGRLLRRTSIDELPQLFNVLAGDMSIVGPRPPLPDEVIEYDDWQRRKLSMKPGITGLWQVKARRENSFELWMQLDLEYIDNWSIWQDARILILTIPAVLKGV